MTKLVALIRRIIYVFGDESFSRQDMDFCMITSSSATPLRFYGSLPCPRASWRFVFEPPPPFPDIDRRCWGGRRANRAVARLLHYHGTDFVFQTLFQQKCHAS